jgi:hypothetical protein
VALTATAVVAQVATLRAGTIRHDRNDSQYTDLADLEKYATAGAVAYNAGVLSGTLISPKWVLTVAHGTNTAATRFFNIGGTTSTNGTGYTGAQHFAHPSYNPNTNPGADVGLIRLSGVVSGVLPASRYFASSEVTTPRITATLVGFGQTGNGNTGDNLPYGTKRAVQNEIDAVGSTVGLGSNFIVMDFDHPDGTKSTFGSNVPLDLEGLGGSGDSGAGVYVDIGSRTYLNSVHAVGISPEFLGADGVINSSYSDSMGAVRVSQFNVWIDDNMTHLWKTATNGTFGTSANWGLGPTSLAITPGVGDIASFRTAGTYTITFGGNVTNHALLARSGNVTLDLNSFSYTLTSNMYEGSLIAGRYTGNIASITFLNGTATVNDVVLGQRVNTAGGVTVGSNATFNANGAVYVGGVFEGAGGTASFNVTTPTSSANIAGTLKVYAAGSVNYSAGSLSANALDVSGGRVILAPGGDKVLRVQSVVVSSNGRIDLADNDMIVNYSGASPIDDVRLLIVTGYNSGAWTGNGLTSSRAATSPNAGEAGETALGYGEASVLGLSSFGGIAVDPTTVVIKYTYSGDADLNGQVDVADLGVLASNWQSAAAWTGGDFDYSSFVDVADLGLLASNWQAGVGIPLGPSFEEALSSVGLPATAVPEPQIGVLLLLGTVALKRRRWRRCEDHKR